MLKTRRVKSLPIDKKKSFTKKLTSIDKDKIIDKIFESKKMKRTDNKKLIIDHHVDVNKIYNHENLTVLIENLFKDKIFEKLFNKTILEIANFTAESEYIQQTFLQILENIDKTITFDIKPLELILELLKKRKSFKTNSSTSNSKNNINSKNIIDNILNKEKIKSIIEDPQKFEEEEKKVTLVSKQIFMFEIGHIIYYELIKHLFKKELPNNQYADLFYNVNLDKKIRRQIIREILKNVNTHIKLSINPLEIIYKKFKNKSSQKAKSI